LQYKINPFKPALQAAFPSTPHYAAIRRIKPKHAAICRIVPLYSVYSCFKKSVNPCLSFFAVFIEMA
jgi:hypothetical protein